MSKQSRKNQVQSAIEHDVETQPIAARVKPVSVGTAQRRKVQKSASAKAPAASAANSGDIPDWASRCLEKLTDVSDRLAAQIEEDHQVLIDHEYRLEDIETLLGIEPMEAQPPAKKAAEPAKAAEPEPAKAPEPEPEPQPEPKKAKVDPPLGGDAVCKNGAGYAYRYWDASTRTYGLTPNIWAAKQVSNGIYDPVWAWFVGGHIDHLLSAEEIRKYCP